MNELNRQRHLVAPSLLSFMSAFYVIVGLVVIAVVGNTGNAGATICAVVIWLANWGVLREVNKRW